MTAAQIALCRCGHSAARHSDEDGCNRPECGCAEFREGDVLDTPAARAITERPADAVAPVAPSPRSAPATRPARQAANPARQAWSQPATPAPAASTTPPAEQAIAAGKRSGSKKTRDIALAVEKRLAELHQRLVKERTDAERRQREDAERDERHRRIAELQRQIDEERAQLRKSRSHVVQTTPIGNVACGRAGCDRMFINTQARAMHVRRAHDGLNPRAKAG